MYTPTVEKLTGFLRQNGASVTLVIPPELLDVSGMRAGDEVVLTAQQGSIVLTPGPRVSQELNAFADRFLDRYRDDLTRLADL